LHELHLRDVVEDALHGRARDEREAVEVMESESSLERGVRRPADDQPPGGGRVDREVDANFIGCFLEAEMPVLVIRASRRLNGVRDLLQKGPTRFLRGEYPVCYEEVVVVMPTVKQQRRARLRMYEESCGDRHWSPPP